MPNAPGAMEPPRLSVITALHAPAVRYLPDAAASLAQQETRLDWIICFDGDAAPPDVVTAVEECRALVPSVTLVASGRAAGPSTARSVALGYVRTPWTAVLDADDVWLPRGLDRLLAVADFCAAPWCAGLTVDLLPDGSRVPFPDYLRDGPVPIGSVAEAYEDMGFLPFHGCAVLWNTAVLWRLGGWPALPTSEDTALVLAASERFEGWYHGGSPVYGYRRHDDQTTAAPAYPARRRLVREHMRHWIAALRSEVPSGPRLSALERSESPLH
ncbi:glycosyltransferase family 2 protein [Yinghuangia aomiensis]